MEGKPYIEVCVCRVFDSFPESDTRDILETSWKPRENACFFLRKIDGSHT